MDIQLNFLKPILIYIVLVVAVFYVGNLFKPDEALFIREVNLDTYQERLNTIDLLQQIDVQSIDYNSILPSDSITTTPSVTLESVLLDIGRRNPFAF